MRDPKERLRDILEAISAVDRYLDRGKAAVERDELLQGWFVRNLQIIGEAAQVVPEETRASAPDVPWAKVIGMRNVLVHGYFDIDADYRLGSGHARLPCDATGDRGAIAETRAAGAMDHSQERANVALWEILQNAEPPSRRHQAEAPKLPVAIAANAKELEYGG